MERNFSRYAQKFVMPASEKTFQFADKLIKQLFHGIIDGEDWGEIARKEEYIDKILDAMESETKQSATISKSDVNEFRDTFTNVTALDNRTLLMSTLLSVFKSISEPENEVYLGRTLASICKRIYLTDTGKIKEVLLEKWGWYVLNYINRNFPEYLKILEDNGVKILNTKNEPMLYLDLQEAVKQFSEDDFEDALHSQTTKIFYEMFSMVKAMIEPIMKRQSNEKQMEAVMKGFKQFLTPQFQALTTIFQIGNARIRRKRSKKADKEDMQN